MTLLDVQRRMASAIFAPLAESDRIDAGADSDYIKPNRRMRSAERLEIYCRSYWFRVLDSLYEDFPGLRAIVGGGPFGLLCRAYLAECPSRSFTLRDLGSRLPDWLKRNRRHAGKLHALAIDMARLEWAHVGAFDGAAEKTLGPEDLLELSPDFRARLQPYIRLLDLTYPVDELRIRVNAADDGRGATSNAAVKQKRWGAPGHGIRLVPDRVFIGVHRLDDIVYYRRLVEEEYLLLDAVSRETPIGLAIEQAFERSSISEETQQMLLEEWFANWARLGWLCSINSTERND